jgi:Ca2+-binding RTX toxin-like protein
MARFIIRAWNFWDDNRLIGADSPDDTDEIHGNEGNDILAGRAGDDVLFGGADDDHLEGGEGDDILSGGAGQDDMLGGPGDDKLYAFSTLATVAGADTGVLGESVATLLIDTFADAFLDEGGLMDGGSGDDTFFVDVALDGVLTIDGGADTDKISFGANMNVWRNGVPASAPANVLNLSTGVGETSFGGRLEVERVENLTGGIYRDHFTGDDNDNVLRGMANDDVLEGLGGADTLDGGSGHDIAHYTASEVGVDVDLLRATQIGGDAEGDRLSFIEEVRGSLFNDVIRGTSDVDVLRGDDGDDILEGRGGGDTINGGSGFDFASYEGSNVGVRVSLPRLGFTPTQNSGHAEGDNLISIEGVIGSRHEDIIVGSDVRNELRGGHGGDRISGLDGRDTLLGEAGGDELFGGNQDDRLDGGFGNDLLHGGNDIDTAAFQGWHGLISGPLSIQISLGRNGGDGFAERRTLTGIVVERDILREIENVDGSNFSEKIQGNELRNRLNGNGGGDRLEGGDEDDVLNGGLGADTLVGGAGRDSFEFDTALGAGNIDTINDFSVLSDTITLDTAVFTELELNGFDVRVLDAEAFRFGAAAVDADDRIIYNSVTGALFYDSDGNGAAAAVQFATIGTLLNLSNDDFVIFRDVQAPAFAGQAFTIMSAPVFTAAADTVTLPASGGRFNALDGDDVLSYQGGLAEIDGGAGSDTVSFSQFDAAVWVDLTYNGREAWTKDAAELNTGVWREIADLTRVENLIGTSYDDFLKGDATDNRFIYAGGLDTLIGDGGADTADFSQFDSAVWVDLTYNGREAWTRDSAELNTGLWREIADLTGIENLVGTAHDDFLKGDTADNRFTYTGGVDTVSGDAGVDTVDFSQFGSAVCVDLATSGRDAWTKDTADLKTGVWREIADLTGIENVVGTAGADLLGGDTTNNRLDGAAGDDRFLYRGGLDTLNGGNGVDTADFSQFGSAVWVSLSYGGREAWTVDRSTLSGGAWREIADLNDIENLTGTAFDDFLQGDARDNIFSYTGGLDTINGGGGADTADFSQFASAVWVDLLYNGREVWTRGVADLNSGVWREIADLAGIEHIVGSVGADVLNGDQNANRLEGGAGNDNLGGRGGTDTFVFASNFGRDAIVDFGVGDALEFSLGAQFDSFEEVIDAASQQGADVVLDFGAHGNLTLQNTQLSTLADKDFLFA